MMISVRLIGKDGTNYRLFHATILEFAWRTEETTTHLSQDDQSHVQGLNQALSECISRMLPLCSVLLL
jgi:hypothetical protein